MNDRVLLEEESFIPNPIGRLSRKTYPKAFSHCLLFKHQEMFDLEAWLVRAQGSRKTVVFWEEEEPLKKAIVSEETELKSEF